MLHEKITSTPVQRVDMDEGSTRSTQATNTTNSTDKQQQQHTVTRTISRQESCRAHEILESMKERRASLVATMKDASLRTPSSTTDSLGTKLERIRITQQMQESLQGRRALLIKAMSATTISCKSLQEEIKKDVSSTPTEEISPTTVGSTLSLPSSTTTTAASSSSSSSSNNKQSLYTKKQVGFDDSKNRTYDCQRYSKSKLRRLGVWYSKDEIDEFKKDVLLSSREILRKERKTSPQRSYRQVLQLLHESSISSLVDADEALESADFVAFDDADFVKLVMEQSGLEKYLLAGFREDRERRRKEIVELVMDLQEMKEMELADKEAMICEESEVISAPSRTFARLSAQVQFASTIDD